ncbi:unnamed protein product [Gordionus sp. m RMFG-2023]
MQPCRAGSLYLRRYNSLSKRLTESRMRIYLKPESINLNNEFSEDDIPSSSAKRLSRKQSHIEQMIDSEISEYSRKVLPLQRKYTLKKNLIILKDAVKTSSTLPEPKYIHKEIKSKYDSTIINTYKRKSIKSRPINSYSEQIPLSNERHKFEVFSNSPIKSEKQIIKYPIPSWYPEDHNERLVIENTKASLFKVNIEIPSSKIIIDKNTVRRFQRNVRKDDVKVKNIKHRSQKNILIGINYSL